jgi:Holliday junction resolvase RusA-like endonuclease
MSRFAFFVGGQPAAQGSKRHVGGGVMVESSTKVKPWRQDVVAAARQAADSFDDVETFAEAVQVEVAFYFTRPKSHYGTGRNANTLKASAPRYVATKPDLDKLLRSTFDALTTAGIWRDDNLAADVWAIKRYGDQAGARIEITPLQGVLP